MKRRVVVTGLGAVTSLSCKVPDLWQRILAGQSGIRQIKLFDTSDFKVKFGGEISDWSTEGYLAPKDAKRIDRFTQFAMVAATDAMTDSGIDFDKVDHFRAGVILGSGIGGLHEIESQHSRLLEKAPTKSRPSPFPS